MNINEFNFYEILLTIEVRLGAEHLHTYSRQYKVCVEGKLYSNLNVLCTVQSEGSTGVHHWLQ